MFSLLVANSNKPLECNFGSACRHRYKPPDSTPYLDSVFSINSASRTHHQPNWKEDEKVKQPETKRSAIIEKISSQGAAENYTNFCSSVCSALFKNIQKGLFLNHRPLLSWTLYFEAPKYNSEP